jgi:hypothetical protein
MTREPFRNFMRLSEDFGKLVASNPDKPCCQSCRSEQDDGIQSEYEDYCCCEHGEVFGYVFDGTVKWVDDGAQKRYEAAEFEEPEE